MKVRSFKRTMFVAASLVLCLFAASIFLECAAQTAPEIEVILRKSKGLDSSQPLRVIVNGDSLVVSTYSHRKQATRTARSTHS